jgi:hypothetical protein
LVYDGWNAEEIMIFVKAVTVLVAGVLTVLTLRSVMGRLQAARARVNPKTPRQPGEMTKLRQDPVTGIYYPEN